MILIHLLLFFQQHKQLYFQQDFGHIVSLSKHTYIHLKFLLDNCELVQFNLLIVYCAFEAISKFNSQFLILTVSPGQIFSSSLCHYDWHYVLNIFVGRTPQLVFQRNLAEIQRELLKAFPLPLGTGFPFLLLVWGVREHT